MCQHAMKPYGSVAICVHDILTSTLEATAVPNTPTISLGGTRPGTQQIRGYQNTRGSFGRVINQLQNSRPVFLRFSSMEKHAQYQFISKGSSTHENDNRSQNIREGSAI
jgi:hypothetical protein